MANNKNIRSTSRSAGRTIGHKSKIASDLAKAGTAITKKATKNSNAPIVKSYREYLEYSPSEVSSLKTSELRSVVARLNKIENKRLKNLEKYGFGTQGYNVEAYRDLSEMGGRTVAGRQMTRQELLHEYKRAKAFLTAETSTVRGASRFIKGIHETVGAKTPMTKDEINMLFEALHKYNENTGALGQYEKGSEQSGGYKKSVDMQKRIYQIMQDQKKDNGTPTTDSILLELGVLEKIDYEASQDTANDFRLFGKYNI